MRLFLAVLAALIIAAIALALGARETMRTHDACIAAGGEPVYDHDGFRCLKAGTVIDPEVSP
jgi:hypothetical protein